LQNVPGGELPVRRFQKVLGRLDVFLDYHYFTSGCGGQYDYNTIM
jgi:hypothetical protein